MTSVCGTVDPVNTLIVIQLACFYHRHMTTLWPSSFIQCSRDLSVTLLYFILVRVPQ